MKKVKKGIKFLLAWTVLLVVIPLIMVFPLGVSYFISWLDDDEWGMCADLQTMKEVLRMWYGYAFCKERM